MPTPGRGGVINDPKRRTSLLALAAATFLSGCLINNAPTFTAPIGSTTPAATSAGLLTTVDATSLTAGFREEYAGVDATAKEWDAGARLYALTVNWPANLAAGTSQRVYVFGSPANPQVWWTLAINEQTQKRLRSLIPRSDYLGSDLPAVATQYWQKNAVEALQIAEAGGGQTVREQHPGAIQVTTSLLARGPKDWLWWVVSYRTAEATTSYYVDPKTGQLYDAAGNLLTATPAES